jgi:hypothetical protein
MAAVAFAGREPAPGSPGSAAVVREDGSAASTRPGETLLKGPPPPVVRPTPDRAPIVASDVDAPITLRIRRHPETMFVHGDVFVPGVSWVFVNLVNDEGRVAGWTSVSVPGGTAPVEGRRPSLRFDVELALPEWASMRLWVQAIAYDTSGAIAATERLGVLADGGPAIEEPRPAGAAPGPTLSPRFPARPGVFWPRLDASWDDEAPSP